MYFDSIFSAIHLNGFTYDSCILLFQIIHPSISWLSIFLFSLYSIYRCLFSFFSLTVRLTQSGQTNRQELTDLTMYFIRFIPVLIFFLFSSIIFSLTGTCDDWPNTSLIKVDLKSLGM